MLAKIHERGKLIERLQVALDGKEPEEVITILGSWMSMIELHHCVVVQEGHVPAPEPKETP